MKKYNKVIAAAMMIMAITVSTPAMANSKKDIRPEHRREMRIHPVRHHHHYAGYAPVHRHHWHAADIHTTAFRVPPHAAHHRHIVGIVSNMRGVRAVDYNPRTHMMTVVYNACITSPRHIAAVIR